MDVQPKTLDAQVPSLLLQPLVENAIRHGIAPNARPGWIAVHASRDHEELLLQIRDSGDGLPPDRLMALNRGVGLDNTRARLEHLYPGISNPDEVGAWIETGANFEWLCAWHHRGHGGKHSAAAADYEASKWVKGLIT